MQKQFRTFVFLEHLTVFGQAHTIIKSAIFRYEKKKQTKIVVENQAQTHLYGLIFNNNKKATNMSIKQ